MEIVALKIVAHKGKFNVLHNVLAILWFNTECNCLVIAWSCEIVLGFGFCSCVTSHSSWLAKISIVKCHSFILPNLQ